jgi:hypothetical protein
MKRPSLREVREIACRIISDRLEVPMSGARLLLQQQMQKEVPYLGRSLTLEEAEEYTGIAVSEILADNDPNGL